MKYEHQKNAELNSQIGKSLCVAEYEHTWKKFRASYTWIYLGISTVDVHLALDAKSQQLKVLFKI